MHDRLNFFEPWENLAPNHENQLTRALLVVLRCCPIAQQAWLSLIDSTLLLHSLPTPDFDTQRSTILRSEDQPPTHEPIKGTSVLCTADMGANPPDVVLQSDRGQVLDGVVRYGDERVIVLESKLGGPADDWQAGNINLHGQPVEFEGSIRKISWHDVLATFTDIADEKRALIAGAERIMLTDFLDFVDRNFAYLGPFNTLRRCEAEPSRVRRRLSMVSSEVLGSDAPTLPGRHLTVALARLEYDENERSVELKMWPADTLQQARFFYKKPEAIERIVMLANDQWDVWPNFHFGFMAAGFCWTTTTLSLAEYVSYWRDNIDSVVQIYRQDWDEYWEKLVKAKVVDQTERGNFDNDFTNTQRPTATPRPGLACVFSWSLDEAERLDSSGKFAIAVKERINQLLGALGEDALG